MASPPADRASDTDSASHSGVSDSESYGPPNPPAPGPGPRGRRALLRVVFLYSAIKSYDACHESRCLPQAAGSPAAAVTVAGPESGSYPTLTEDNRGCDLNPGHHARS
jgi:hypothetical protein